MPYKDPDAQRNFQARWVAERRKAYLAGRTCANCGAAEQLQVHHVDPTQKVDHKVWSWSRERREAELAKCVVLCEPCHIAEHSGPEPDHGVRARYKQGCRCLACRRANADYSAAQKAARKAAA